MEIAALAVAVLSLILIAFGLTRAKPAPSVQIEDHEIVSFDPRPPEPLAPEPVPSTVPSTVPVLSWEDQRGAFKLTRIMCDEAGLTYEQKNILCACIYQESRFRNRYADGSPVINKNIKDGTVWSTDWGIVQINDTEGWHIGPGLAFESVEDVLDHPARAVGYMIRMYKAGKLHLWSSYKLGHYKQWLPTGSPMWALKT